MAKKPIKVAIAYDFDGTLAPGNMQERDFIPAVGTDTDAFWREVKRLARIHEGDEILAYMGLMIRRANNAEVPVRKEAFREFGRRLQLFKGLENYQDRNRMPRSGWFERINNYGQESDLMVEHFIVSSGIREMIVT